MNPLEYFARLSRKYRAIARSQGSKGEGAQSTIGESFGIKDGPARKQLSAVQMRSIDPLYKPKKHWRKRRVKAKKNN